MGTKKSAVDEMKGTQISLNLKKGEYQFIVGETIRPDWDVVHYVLSKLYEYNYAKELLGSEDEASTLIFGNREQLEYYVPLMCRLIDTALITSKYEIALHPQLIAIAYVLAWYWHFSLGGPRPIYDPKRYRPKAQLRIEWRCPVCTKEFEPPKRFVHIQPKYNAYIAWLKRHGVEYHKEWSIPK